MLPRHSSARRFPPSASSGRAELTFAQVIVFAETAIVCFSRPLIFAAFFVALAWLGVFSKLYPWAHLVALVLFVIFFFDAVGRARIMWRRPSLSLAMRRVEEASGLYHRPLDVLQDRPVGSDADAHSLWQEHVLRARRQVKKLRLPEWKLDWAAHDPYRLRYIVGVLLTLGLITGWGALGGRIIAAINPALGKLQMTHTTIDAWISPPEYTHLPPIMIATPAGDRYQGEVIKVPEGSVLHAHLAEKDGTAPVLSANGESTEFSAENGKDFNVTQSLSGGDSIAIKRGWMTLASWHIRIVPDTAPQIAFTDAPTATERKDVRIAYDAHDDYGVTNVKLRITLRESLVDVSNEPLEVSLASAEDKDIKRVAFQNLTAEAWAGLPVDLQLIATDAYGHEAQSDKAAFTLPERNFFNPVARALIEERKKLLRNNPDVATRTEAANLMAGLAHHPESFGGDAVIMMSLRIGAVRLVLDHDQGAASTVKDILWQTATRIEDGNVGMAEQNLRQAQQDLSDALDHNASERDIQGLIDRLHDALARYLTELSTHMTAHSSAAEDLGQALGQRMNVLTPDDLNRMLEQMKNLSASGARSAAREELARLQQTLENLRTQNPELTQDQKAALDILKDLRKLASDQQTLLDQTYQKTQNDKIDKTETFKLTESQATLQKRLQDMTKKTTENDSLSHSADAMNRAATSLRQGAGKDAVAQQSEALEALHKAEQSMASAMQQSLFGLPQMGAGKDPFGREGGQGLPDEGQGVHVPDHIQAGQVRAIMNEIQSRAGDMTRSKTEREYIERLLQNF